LAGKAPRGRGRSRRLTSTIGGSLAAARNDRSWCRAKSRARS